MLDTPTVLQRLIDAKNWKELSEYNIINVIQMKHLWDVSFTKEFFTEFFLDRMNFNTLRNVYLTDDNAPNSTVEWQVLIKNVFEIISEGKMGYDVMGKTYDFFFELRETYGKSGLYASNIIGWANKNDEYFRFLMANNEEYFNKTVEWIDEIGMGSRMFRPEFMVPRSLVNNLSESEKELFLEKFAFYQDPSYPSFEEKSQIHELTKDFKKSIKIYDSIRANKNYGGELFVNVPWSEFEEILNYVLDNKGDESILRWFKRNDDFPRLPDETLKKMMDNYDLVHYSRDLFPMLLKDDQLKDYADDFDMRYFFNNKSIELKTIAEAYKVQERNIFHNITEAHRFFTNEEIANNPYFFDPRHIKDEVKYHVTRETFDKLKKYWQPSVNYRYNTDLNNFYRIVNNFNPKSILTLDDIKYIAKETRTSSRRVVNSLKMIFNRSGHRKYSKSLKEKFGPIFDLMDKYKK